MKQKYMGQIMAECDCQHHGCEVRGYCMAEKIADLEKERERLDAGWHDANKEILHIALIAQTAEAALAEALAVPEVRALVEALILARAHVANNEQGWSVGRYAARSDLEIVDAALRQIGGEV